MESFLESRLQAQLTRRQCAKLFDVSETTISNWETKPPKNHIFLILKYYSNDLSFISPAWNGFYAKHNHIITPEEEIITTGDIRSFRWLRMTINFLKEEQTKKRRFNEFTLSGARKM